MAIELVDNKGSRYENISKTIDEVFADTSTTSNSGVTGDTSKYSDINKTIDEVFSDTKTSELSSNTSEYAKRLGSEISDIGSDLTRSFSKGLINAGNTVLGQLDLLGIDATKTLDPTNKSGKVYQDISSRMSKESVKEQKDYDNVDGFVDTVKFLATHPRTLVNKTVEQVPNLMCMVGEGAAFKALGLGSTASTFATNSLTSAGGVANQAAHEGKSYGEYIEPALLAGAASGLIGTITGKVGGNLESTILNRSRISSVPASMAGEGIEEMGQSA